MKTNPLAKSQACSSKHPSPVLAFLRAGCRSTLATHHPTDLLRQSPSVHHPRSTSHHPSKFSQLLEISRPLAKRVSPFNSFNLINPFNLFNSCNPCNFSRRSASLGSSVVRKLPRTCLVTPPAVLVTPGNPW